MAGDWLEVRDRVKDVLAENLVRPTRKVTTLDYLDPGDFAVLEERFTIPRRAHRRRLPRLAVAARSGGAPRPAGAGQRVLVGGLGGGGPGPWPCPRHPGGRVALPARDPRPRWLAAGRLGPGGAGGPQSPAPPADPVARGPGRRGARPSPRRHRGTARGARGRAPRRLRAVPARAPAGGSPRCPDMRRSRSEPGRMPPPAGCPSPPASAAARPQAARSPRPSPGDDVPTVRSSRPSPGDNVPTVEPPEPHGVRAPRYTQEDEQRRREELARKAAEQARQQAERQRGPRKGSSGRLGPSPTPRPARDSGARCPLPAPRE